MGNRYQAAAGGTIAVANSGTASAAAALPESADSVVLYNDSSTAVAFFRCDNLYSAADAGGAAVIPVPGTPGGIPVPPQTQICIAVGAGAKKFSVIASAADGTLYITPGTGN